MREISKDWKEIFDDMTPQERLSMMVVMWSRKSKRPREILSALIFSQVWASHDVVQGFDTLTAPQRAEVIESALRVIQAVSRVGTMAEPAPPAPPSSAAGSSPKITDEKVTARFEVLTEPYYRLAAIIGVAVLAYPRIAKGFGRLAPEDQKDVVDLAIRAMQTTTQILSRQGQGHEH